MSASRASSSPRAPGVPPRGRSGVRVRQAGEDDVPGVVRCLHAAFAPFRSQYTAAAYAETTLTRWTALERLRSMRVLVAVDRAGRVLGTVAWVRKPSGIGYLRGMAVDPRWQGSRVAERLLDRALADLYAAGARRVTLHTTHPLGRAIGFYRRNGFRPTGRQGEFFGMETLQFARALTGRKRPSRSRPRRETGSRARRSSR